MKLPWDVGMFEEGAVCHSNHGSDDWSDVKDSPFSCDSSIPMRVVGFSTPRGDSGERSMEETRAGQSELQDRDDGCKASAFWNEAQRRQVHSPKSGMEWARGSERENDLSRPETHSGMMLRKQSSQLSQQLMDVCTFEMKRSRLPTLNTAKCSEGEGKEGGASQRECSSDAAVVQDRHRARQRRYGGKQKHTKSTGPSKKNQEINHDTLAGTLPTAETLRAHNEKQHVQQGPHASHMESSPGGSSSEAMPIPRMSRAFTAPNPLPEISPSIIESIIGDQKTSESPHLARGVKESKRQMDHHVGEYAEIPTARFLEEVANLTHIQGELSNRILMSQQRSYNSSRNTPSRYAVRTKSLGYDTRR